MRGRILRLVLERRNALVLGATLCAPAILLWWRDYRWESWLTEGSALVLGATGVALILAGLGGRRPDWYDLDE